MIPLTKNEAPKSISVLRTFLYGPPKTGKSTFATRNPRALVLDTDNNGTGFLDCFRVSINSWDELKKALGELAKEEHKGRFDTIVIDTVDRAWQMCRDSVCQRFGVAHESEDKAFGRLWDIVKQEFLKMVSYISGLGMGIMFLSHSMTKEVKIGISKRNVTTCTLPDKAARMVMAFCDVIMYMDEDDNGKRTLFLKPSDSLECGDRTKKLTENIPFTSEQEAYDKILQLFKGETK